MLGDCTVVQGEGSRGGDGRSGNGRWPLKRGAVVEESLKSAGRGEIGKVG